MNQNSVFSSYIWTSTNYNRQRIWDFVNEPDLACAMCGKRYPAHSKRYSQLAVHMDGHAKFKLPPPASVPHPHEFTDLF